MPANEVYEHDIRIVPGETLDAKALPTHGGVFLVEDRDGKPVLLASAENLRRVVLGRLAAPPEQRSKRMNLAEIAERVRWRATFSRFETTLEHWRMMRSHDPKGYRQQIGFGPAWFLRVDTSERTPRFETVNTFSALDVGYLGRGDTASGAVAHGCGGVRCFGPFATRPDTDEWVHLLEDLFDLCRYHQVLVQSPAGQACAYAEMGRCSAPCNGSIPLEDYRRIVTAAADYTAGDHATRLFALRAAMAAAAADLAFEKAAAIRQTVERAEAALRRPAFQQITEGPRLRWLVVQRGGPRSRSTRNALIKPFYVRVGVVDVGEAVKLAEIDAAAPAWLDQCNQGEIPPPMSKDEQIARCEALWLVSKFLFQGEKAPGLFLRFDQLPNPDRLANMIRGMMSRNDDSVEQEPPAEQDFPAEKEPPSEQEPSALAGG